MSTLTPREIVAELDKFVVGQEQAKRMVAVAVRNRWRRQHLSPELRDEVAPKNIIMMGHRRGQNRNCPPPGQVVRRALYQGGSHQVHGSGLCGTRCGVHGA